MKKAYPVVMTPVETGFVVSVPDFNIDTQGADIIEAIEMARDAIGIIGIDMQDDGEELPDASDLEAVRLGAEPGETVTLVDIDFSDSRRKNDLRTVKKNCTVPAWLCYEAEHAGINFSAVLQKALKAELHITDR